MFIGECASGRAAKTGDGIEGSSAEHCSPWLVAALYTVGVDEVRPLPKPPRCRGIPLGDGNFTGCAYGYGDVAPYDQPCDCPVCNGSGIEGVAGIILPHAEFGDPECCGCLVPILGHGHADLVCNECALTVRTVSLADLRRVLDEMELSLDVASEICPKCGAANLFPGFSKMAAFTCSECGAGVRVR